VSLIGTLQREELKAATTGQQQQSSQLSSTAENKPAAAAVTVRPSTIAGFTDAFLEVNIKVTYCLLSL
jgi:hypothetical protein